MSKPPPPPPRLRSRLLRSPELLLSGVVGLSCARSDGAAITRASNAANIILLDIRELLSLSCGLGCRCTPARGFTIASAFTAAVAAARSARAVELVTVENLFVLRPLLGRENVFGL